MGEAKISLDRNPYLWYDKRNERNKIKILLRSMWNFAHYISLDCKLTSSPEFITIFKE